MSELWTPHDYQKWAIDIMLEESHANIFMSPGAGKTSICLECINVWKQRTLISCPIRPLYSAWPGEMEKWSNFNNIRWVIMHGAEKEAMFLRLNAGIYLINPEGLKWLISTMRRYKRFPWKILIVDESTDYKNPLSKRTEYIHSIRGMFDRSYILSGTPVPNGYLDLWSQTFITDGGQALGNNFYAYRNKYFHLKHKKSFKYVLPPEFKPLIDEKLKPTTIWLDVRDHLKDLPEPIEVDIELQLDEKNRKLYNEMEKKMFFELMEQAEDGKKITALTAASCAQKCSQIVNGHVFETLNEIQKLQKIKPKSYWLHDIKIDATIQLVEELAVSETPLLIVYFYKAEQHKLFEAFPDAPHIGSGVSGTDSKRIEDEWNAGMHPVLLGHVDSVKRGLNLQGCEAAVLWYCLTYSFEAYYQTNLRVCRQGSKSLNTMIYRLIVKKSIDEVKKATIADKDQTNASFVTQMRRYFRLYYK